MALPKRIQAKDIAKETIVGDNVLPNTITGGASGQLALATISTDNLVANTIVAGDIAANTITTTEIAATTITGGNINTLDLTSKTLTADTGTIGGYTMSTTALYAGTAATRVQLDTTSGIHLGATAFADAPFRVNLAGDLTASSATITGAITTGAGSAVDGQYLDALSIAAAAIAANAVTEDKILADAVTANKINVANLAAINADMGTITAGTITGATIQTAASGRRTLMNSDGITLYNASGNIAGYINNVNDAVGGDDGSSAEFTYLAVESKNAGLGASLRISDDDNDHNWIIGSGANASNEVLRFLYYPEMSDDSLMASLTLSGTEPYTGRLGVDWIDELTAANGVTIDGLNIKDGYPTPECMVMARLATDATINDATATTVVFGAEDFDVGSNFNTSTGVFTAPSAGIYEVSYGIRFYDGQSVLDRAFVEILLNGTDEHFRNEYRDDGIKFYNFTFTATYPITLAATNTLAIRVWGNTTDSGTFIIDGHASDPQLQSYLYIRKVSN